MRAVEGYDPDMNTRFSTYAAYWINQSIRRGIVNTGKTVRVPSYVAQLLGRWRIAANRLAEELGRPATREEVAARLGITRRQAAAVAEAMRGSQAGSVGADEGQGMEELVADPRQGEPGAAMMHASDLARMRDLMSRLSQREALVLRMRYGLGEEPTSLKAIGEHLGLTRERVRQIEGEALEKLGTGFAD
jgi:RNA polymerase primary sigma factor